MNRIRKQLGTKIAAILFLGIFLFLSLISGCATAPPAEPIHTAYNVWYERPERIYSLNYMTGTLIAAGTRVLNYNVERNRINFETERGSYSIQFAQKYHPGLSIHDFSDRLFTHQSFEALTQGLNEKEIKAIRRGDVIKGMSKEAVRISLGPPPGHKTPSFENDTWIYWESRFRKKIVRFDENGKIAEGY